MREGKDSLINSLSEVWLSRGKVHLFPKEFPIRI